MNHLILQQETYTAAGSLPLTKLSTPNKAHLILQLETYTPLPLTKLTSFYSKRPTLLQVLYP